MHVGVYMCACILPFGGCEIVSNRLLLNVCTALHLCISSGNTNSLWGW